jgi:hypothetical protein
VSGSSGEDVTGIAELSSSVDVITGTVGSCHQRNAALDLAVGKYDVVTFLDDDFVPRFDYLGQVEQLFLANDDVVGIGGRLIADGATNEGIEMGPALELVANDVNSDAGENAAQALYGCNMSLRVSALGDLRFDERLPLYGWLEDIDLTTQLAKRGRLIKSNKVAGVHLGIKSGKTAGKRFGYSQIANPVYLKRKGTMQPGLGSRLIFQQVLSNMLRCIHPEPYIDRRGRLVGNMIAIADIVTGRMKPERVLDL